MKNIKVLFIFLVAIFLTSSVFSYSVAPPTPIAKSLGGTGKAPPQKVYTSAELRAALKAPQPTAKQAAKAIKEQLAERAAQFEWLKELLIKKNAKVQKNQHLLKKFNLKK